MYYNYIIKLIVYFGWYLVCLFAIIIQYVYLYYVISLFRFNFISLRNLKSAYKCYEFYLIMMYDTFIQSIPRNVIK